MPSYRINRINQDVKREVADIIRSMKDPRLSVMLSVVKVDVTADLSYATIFVSALEGEEKTREAVKALKSAAGYVRRELGGRLGLRKTPELRFIADNSIAHGIEIARILNDIDADKTETETDENDSEQ